MRLHGEVAPLVDTRITVTHGGASAAASEAQLDSTSSGAAVVVASEWTVRVTALDTWGNRHSAGGLGVAATATTTDAASSAATQVCSTRAFEP